MQGKNNERNMMWSMKSNLGVQPLGSPILVWSIVFLCAIGLLAPRPSASQILQVQDPLAGPNPQCLHPAYTPVPPPDVIQAAFNERGRFRLVIGVGKNTIDPTMDRLFVDPTAALVDKQLELLGFKPLPSLEGQTPYLYGPSATKTAIMKALNEMVMVTNAQDFGVIYYVGHGSITFSNKDLTLSVYDRPVKRDEGIRVSDILGTLEFSDFRSDVNQIPHYLVVLDACFSGNVARGNKTYVSTEKNVQRLEQIQGLIVPQQIAIMAATSDGDSSSAYELHGYNTSAFGYYFARALNKDWACSDNNSPDGILTLTEVYNYIKRRLKVASDQHLTDALMAPTILNKDVNAFIAYKPSKHAIDGLRDEIVEIVVRPVDLIDVAIVTLPSGNKVRCPPRCAVYLSKNSVGSIKVESGPPQSMFVADAYGWGPAADTEFYSFGSDSLKSVLRQMGVELNGAGTPVTGTISMEQLLQRKQVAVAGVSLQVR